LRALEGHVAIDPGLAHRAICQAGRMRCIGANPKPMGADKLGNGGKPSLGIA